MYDPTASIRTAIRGKYGRLPSEGMVRHLFWHRVFSWLGLT